MGKYKCPAQTSFYAKKVVFEGFQMIWAGNEPADAGTDHQHRARVFLFVTRTGLDKRLLYELLRKPSF